MAKSMLDQVFKEYGEIVKLEAKIDEIKAKISPMIEECVGVHKSSFGPVAVPGYEEKQYVNIRKRGGKFFMCFRPESQGGFGSWLKGKPRAERAEPETSPTAD